MVLALYEQLTTCNFHVFNWTFLVGFRLFASDYVLQMFWWNNLASRATVLETAGMFVRETNKSSLLGAKFPMKKKSSMYVLTHYK